MTDLGALAPERTSLGLSLSADGLVVVGQSGSISGDRAFRWTSSGGMVGLGTLSPGDVSSIANGTNADGSVVVGFSFGFPSLTLRAFRWTSAAGMQDLGVLPGFVNAEATCVSADGVVVAGTCSNTPGVTGPAFIWTAGGGMVELESLTPSAPSTRPMAMTADGSTIVGTSSSGFGNRAFRWTPGLGTQSLGTLPGDTSSEAFGVSADGRTVVGRSSGVGNSAFLWNLTLGMVDLRAQLVTLGTDMSDWGDLVEARAVSADGSVIAGTGVYKGVTQAFVIRGYPACVPIISAQPEDQSVCAASTVSVGISASGQAPLSYRWQLEDPQTPGGWLTLFDGPLFLDGVSQISVSIVGAFAGFDSVVSFTPAAGGRLSAIEGRRVRCQISSNCQGRTSREALLRVCVADLTCDAQVDLADFVPFVEGYNVFLCDEPAMPVSCPADLNRDGSVDNADFLIFVAAYNDFLCP